MLLGNFYMSKSYFFIVSLLSLNGMGKQVDELPDGELSLFHELPVILKYDNEL